MTEEKAEHTTEKTYTRRQVALAVNVASRRQAYARSMQGITAYGGRRDYWEVLGYTAVIEPEAYRLRYERQDIAKRIVELPCNDTWKNPPVISENDDVDTPFVRAWLTFVKKFRTWSLLRRADILSGIGHFGVIMLGVNDEKLSSVPIGEGRLLYLRPYSQERVAIATWETNTTSKRYGLPLTYNITTSPGETGDFPGTGTIAVHYTRVIHLAEGRLDSETFGMPRLKSVYNLLDDAMKIVGGTAEATWLNMRPGLAIGPKDGFSIDDGADATDAFLDEIDRYANDPLRVLRLIGMEANPIGGGQVMDSTAPADTNLSRISAATGIPQRVLIGSASGDLASAREDMRQWAGQINTRQTTYVEPDILYPFIDKMIAIGELPAPSNGYTVGTLQPDGQTRRWPTILEQTDDEQAETTLKKAQAITALRYPGVVDVPTTETEDRELLGYKPKETENAPVTMAFNSALELYEEGDIEAELLLALALGELGDREV